MDVNINDANKKKLFEKLEIAVENQQFYLVYQPKINLDSGKIVGMEALIRWEDPEEGVISPLTFIPLAEETGLILSLGEWVIREACEQNKKWQKMGLPPFVIAVNLSVRQLYQPDLIERIQAILTETGLAPEYLEMEITENIMMNAAYTLPVIKKLKSLGVRLSLDDFGTGYSSLSYLKEFPFDEIKIDRSFLCSDRLNVKDETIIKAIIAMVQRLNLTVVAEGIETVEQLVFLQQNLCDKGQGYFFSRPLLPEEIVLNFNEIEHMIKGKEVQKSKSKRDDLMETLEDSQKSLHETVRRQHGMIFKFILQDGKFVHTIADGELLYKIGLTPELLIGRSLVDVIPIHEAAKRKVCYWRAWGGETDVTYESKLNGVHYFTSLQPVWRDGDVVEVIGSSVDITTRIESEERFQKIADYTSTGVLIYRGEEIFHANPAALSILGDDIIGMSINDFVINGKQEKFPAQVHGEGNEGFPPNEMILQLPNGRVIDIEMTLIATKYEGKPAVLALFSDETEIKTTERIFQESKKELEDVNFALNESSIVAITNQKGKIQFVNEKFTEISGYEKEELLGQDHRIINSGYHPKSFFKEIWRTIGTGNTWRGEIRNRAKDGSYYWVDTTIVPFLNKKGIPYQYVSIRTDITERKEMEEALRINEEKLKHIAFHDSLTGIPNRLLFLKELDTKIQMAKKDNERFAVAYIDIDSFKKINDTYGHDTGDQALKEFVRKIKSRLDSTVFFARQGGDEFMLLIPIVKDEKEVVDLLNCIVERLQTPSEIGEKLLASFGVAIYPEDGETRDRLMKHADEALYRAKSEGKNKYRMYRNMN